MCGRFVSAAPPDELARYFHADVTEVLLPPSYNVAPTNDVYAVLETGGLRRVEALHWGLVPRWAKDPATGYKMINARAESVATKNAYRSAFRSRRCIVPADGFYEWQVVPGRKRKQPMFIHRRDGAPLAFAGLWEVWRDPNRPEDPPLRSCTIITGPANDTVAPVHDRMPVVLPETAWDTWLDPEDADLEALGRLLVPASASLFELWPVGTDVNNVRVKDAHLIERVDPETGEITGQATLL